MAQRTDFEQPTGVEAQWSDVGITWAEAPAAARGVSVKWQDVTLPLADRKLLLVDGQTDRTSGRTQFHVRFGGGKRSPVVTLALALVRSDGAEVHPIEGGATFRVGDIVEFAGIANPRDIASVRYRAIPAA